jgi:ABC-type glycerol-3-phosphate transport system permease component
MTPRLARSLQRIPVHLTLILLSFIAMVPIYFMFITAFKSKAEYFENQFGLPRVLSVEHFIRLAEGGLVRQLGNTILLTAVSCTMGIALAALAAFAFARLRFRGQTSLFNATIALLAMPTVVVIVPLYATMARLDLVNTYFGASLVYAGFMLPFSIFVLTSFFKTLPVEVMDAARIDGCSDLATLLYVVLPMSRPALITLFIVNALGVWNDLLVALLMLQNNDMRTVVVELAMMKSRYSTQIPLMLTGSIFVGLPVMIAFIFGQKYFVRGLASGAVK